jgi:hypothetical protein
MPRAGAIENSRRTRNVILADFRLVQIRAHHKE